MNTFLAQVRSYRRFILPHPTPFLPHLKIDSNSLNSYHKTERICEYVEFKALINASLVLVVQYRLRPIPNTKDQRTNDAESSLKQH